MVDDIIDELQKDMESILSENDIDDDLTTTSPPHSDSSPQKLSVEPQKSDFETESEMYDSNDIIYYDDNTDEKVIDVKYEDDN